MNPEIIKIIINELNRGQIFRDFAGLYHILADKIPQEQLLEIQRSIKPWWLKLEEILYYLSILLQNLRKGSGYHVKDL